MTMKRKCHSKSNSFVAAAEQVCLQPVLEHRQRWGRRIIAGQAIPQQIQQFAKSSHCYGNSLAMWDHTVSPATRQRWHSRLYPSKAGTRFSDLGGMHKAELTKLAGYIPIWYTRPKTVTHLSTNRARRALTSFVRWTPLTTTPRRQPTKATEPHYTTPGNKIYLKASSKNESSRQNSASLSFCTIANDSIHLYYRYGRERR